MKAILLLVAVMASAALSAQHLDSVDYKIEGKVHRAFYAKPAVVGARTATVLIVHEWWGLNEYPKQRALQLASEGYIAVCIDMYGVGKMAPDPQTAKALSEPFYKNPEMAYNRFMAGYDAAVKISGVNPEKMVAIGYCFGGAMVLNAAKHGAPVDAVVSFHGGLAGIPVDGEKLTASVLVCHGAADQFVPQTDIDALQRQMNENGEDYTFISYPNATHAFTNPNATETGKQFGLPIEYNEAADLTSWGDFHKFMKQKVR